MLRTFRFLLLPLRDVSVARPASIDFRSTSELVSWLEPEIVSCDCSAAMAALSNTAASAINGGGETAFCTSGDLSLAAAPSASPR